MSTEYEAWDDFFAGLETGDMILMHGLFESSMFIELFMGCHWSHSALVIISDDIGLTSVPSGTVLLWESNIKDAVKDNPNGLTVTDVMLNTVKGGPMVDRLAERITNNAELKYDGDIAKRKLTYERSADFFSTLKTAIDGIHSDTFPSIPEGETRNYLMGKFMNRPVEDGTFFCSQLVGHTYKALGLLTDEWVDNWYAPANFAECFWDHPLQKGATLGPEIRLDLSTIPPYPGY